LYKAEELFRREAAILYQIQHPQIPRFRATFEQDKRLFLVQDYVEGHNFRSLLDTRKAKGKTFTEPEVLHLLVKVLPVLDYLHQRGIIHRDISPDNIILRQADQLPVLIDFGVVKEVATRLGRPVFTQSTSVGKLGFAPSEQLHSGRAYPASDLYALAATALVLLTGREPQDLFDDHSLSWRWDQVPPISPALLDVLTRMLAYRPQERVQSAAEVLAALQASPTTGSSPPPQRPLSQVRTVAAGRRPSGAAIAYPPTRLSTWDNPVVLALLSMGIVAVCGGGAWWAVTSLLTRPAVPPLETPDVAPAVPDPAPPVPSASPAIAFAFDLKPGVDTTLENEIQAGAKQRYQFSAEAGQALRIGLRGTGVRVRLWGPNQEPLATAIDTTWDGSLPTTGTYALEVMAATESSYRLTLKLASPVVSPPSPLPTPTALPSPTVTSQRLTLTDEQAGDEVTAQVSPQKIQRYLVSGTAGQRLSLDILSGIGTFRVTAPDGTILTGADSRVTWSGELPTTGDYQIDLGATDTTDTTLRLRLKSPDPPTPAPTP
ncbi:MAG: serine/threonine protein kinase, partial [Gloeomargaritaceae cyanobacterium C42_A2020_066]|nr:serine/threonine protein kinase [Gloeomargaritaceae cyanobacterium C42_A2020_066]